jgi:hypothetical protein
MVKTEFSAGAVFWAGAIIALFAGVFILTPGYSDGPTIVHQIGTGAATVSGATDSLVGGIAWLNQTLNLTENIRVCNITYTESNQALNTSSLPFNTKFEIINSTGTIGTTNTTVKWNRDGKKHNASLTSCVNLIAGTGYKLVASSNGKEFGYNMSNTAGYIGGAFWRYDNNWATYDADLIFWNEVTAAAPPAITGNVSLTAPVETNYTTTALLYNFTAISSNRTYINCWQNINGNVLGINGDGTPYNATNNTAASVLVTDFTAGEFGTAWALNLICDVGPGTNVTSNYRNFTTNRYLHNETISQTAVYEGQLNNFTLTIQLAQAYSGTNCIDAKLQYNGTNYTANIYAVNPSPYSYGAVRAWVNLSAQAVTTNNTPYAFRWYYSNGPGFPGCLMPDYTASSSANQNVYYAMATESLNVNPNAAIGGESYNLDTILRIYYNGSATRTINAYHNGTTYLSSFYSSNATHETYRTTLTAGSVSDADNATFLENSTFYAGGILRSQTSANVTFYRIFFGDCAGIYTTKAYNLTFYNEENTAQPVTTSLEINGTYYYGGVTYGFNATKTGAYYYEFCLYPGWKNYTVNAISRYWAPGNTTRYFYIVNATASNLTIQNPLYLLDASLAYNVSVNVVDVGGNFIEGVYVYFMRYFVGTNTYLTVDVIKTSGLGADKAPLRINDVYYRIVGIKDGNVLFSKEPWQGSTSLSITYNSNEAGYFWSYYKSISGVCALAADNVTLSCQAADSSGLAHTVNLKVYEQGPITQTLLCDISGLSTATGLNCNLGNSTNKAYRYLFTANMGAETATLSSGWLYGTKTNVYGGTGLFFSALFMVGLAAAGAFNPSVSLVFATAALGVAAWGGWLSLTFGGFAGLGIVIGFIIWRLNA